MRPVRWVALVAALLLVAGACGRDDESTETAESNSGSTTSAASGDGEDGLDDGAFGDLGVICRPGDEVSSSTSETGVTADTVQIGTFSDPGFAGRLGLNQELFDTAEAFTKWCNEHGGLNGREIVLELRDAKLSEFQQRVIEACDGGDFMVVGGGTAFDDTGQADRLGCGLPAIVGYAVSAEAAGADLSIQPLPNPSDELSVGSLRYLEQQFPESTENVAIFTAAIESTQSIADAVQGGDHDRVGLGHRVRRHLQPARRDELAPVPRADAPERRRAV